MGKTINSTSSSPPGRQPSSGPISDHPQLPPDLTDTLSTERLSGLEQAFKSVLGQAPIVSKEAPQPHYASVGADRLPPPVAHGIVGVYGAPRSGKDLAADYLIANYSGVASTTISDNIIAEANESLNGSGHHIDHGNKVEPVYRRLLQEWGQARAETDKDYWMNKTLAHAQECLDKGCSTVFITGVRRTAEADSIRQRSGSIWQVSRPAVSGNDGHMVENQMAEYQPDTVINNDIEGDLRALENNIEAAFANG